MFNNVADYKRIGLLAVIFFVIIVFPTKFNYAFAVSDDSEQILNDNIDSILSDINFDELDEFTYGFSDDISFEKMTREILNGKYYTDYHRTISSPMCC